MSASAIWLSRRGRIAIALSLFFVWATYYLWSGERGKWGLPTSSVTNTNTIQESNSDYNNDDNHYAFHTKTYTPASAPKSTNIDSEPPEDYDNYLAKTFTAQATPVHTADGEPTATPLPDEFDDTPIRELCAQTSWGLSKDVVINCGGRVGGVGTLFHPLHTNFGHLIDSICCRQCATRNPGVC
jgi:hypothetical protein